MNYIKRLPRKKKKKLIDKKRYHSDRYRYKLYEAIEKGIMVLSFDNGEMKHYFPRTLKARQNAIPAQKWYAQKMKETKEKMAIAYLAYENNK